MRLNISLRRWTPRTVCTARLGRPLSAQYIGAKRSSSIRGSASFRKTSAQLRSKRLAFFGGTRNSDCHRLTCGSRSRNMLTSPRPGAAPRRFPTLSLPCPSLARGFYERINFDQVGKLEDQIARALEDFSLATCAASDFLVKPLDPTELINVPKLNQHVEALKQFGVIGITAREAGNSFLKRCSSIVMLRDILNDARLDTPIHVFGAINPYEVLAYFFCGADIFDGLNWLRLAFRNAGSVPIDETATEDMNWSLMGWDLQAVQCTYNLTLLFRLQEAMREYAASGAIEPLVEEFPLARQAARIAEIAGAETRN